MRMMNDAASGWLLAATAMDEYQQTSCFSKFRREEGKGKGKG
jgi:hypothetical protein